MAGSRAENGVCAGLGLLAAAVVITGCATAPGMESAGESAREAPVPAPVRAARVARAQEGAPYRYGGDGPRAFDCSGLVHYAYGRAGLDLPRTVARLRRTARPVDPERLQTGDLLFFRFGGKPAHVGLYLGDGRFVHAPKTGERVALAELDHPFWRGKLVGAGRPYPPDRSF